VSKLIPVSDFIMSENVLQVAVGLMCAIILLIGVVDLTFLLSVAKGFTDVVNSFVSDILLPPVSLLPFIGRNFEAKFLVMKRGPHYNQTISSGYNTLKQAADDGAVTFNYGYRLQRHVFWL
jgi:large conductance mechanosensitive channel